MSLKRRQLLKLFASFSALAATTAPSAVSKALNSNSIIKPERLRQGMTIGLVTPASNVPEDEDLLAASDFVRSLGFEVKTSPNLRSRKQYLAGSDRQRADDLNSMFANPEVDAIFCIRGGYGSGRLLRSLDYETIAINPKISEG